MIASIAQHVGIGLQQTFLALDAFLDGLQVSAQTGTTRLGELLLGCHHLSNLRVAHRCQQVRVPVEPGCPLLLREQTPLHGAYAKVALPV